MKFSTLEALPPTPSEKTASSRKIWYNLVHGPYRTPTNLHFRARAGTQEWYHALFPTDSGVDEAGLYRAQVGGELLAGTTRAACGTGSGPEGRSGSTPEHQPRLDPAALRRQKRKIGVSSPY